MSLSALHLRSLPPLPRVAGGTTAHAWRWLALQLLLVGGWVALFLAARLLEYAPHASLWFPPAAVTFAGFAMYGRHALPAFIVACHVGVLLTLQRDGIAFDLPMLLRAGALFSLAHCLPYATLAWAVRRAIGDAALPSITRAVGVMLAGGGVAALAAATLGALGTAWAGLMPMEAVAPTVLPWLIGDLAGLLAIGPLVAVALRHVAPTLHRPEVQRLLAQALLPLPPRGTGLYLSKLALMLGSTALALFAVAAAPGYAPLMFGVFVAILVQLWIVHTHAALQSLLAIALFSVALAVLVAALDLDAHALTLQFALITLAASSYFGLTVPMLYADNAQLRGLLIHDSLTGAYSRHFFVELAERALAQARREDQPVSLLMIDLDYLKLINDAHGHAVGDRVLAQMAHAAQQVIGPRGVLGRLSGDEFAALLPQADGEAARDCAARLLLAVETMPSPLPEVLSSCSIGIATARPGEDYASLLGRADTALYAAKRGGRGRAQLA